MKECRECHQVKNIGEFYTHPRMSDGHLNKCKDCVKNRVSKHRDLNIDRIREYDKERSSLPHRLKARSDYQKTEEGKTAKKKAQEKYDKTYPLRYAARFIVRKGLRNGTISRPATCSECGSDQKIEGHHDDYTKPLDIRWLCEKCHKKWHRHNKPIYE